MSDEIQKADQIAFHFYTKLFYAVHDARATEGARPQAKVDKWFNLETPDCDLFTRDAREPYRSVSLASSPGPPPLEIEVLLSVPELSSNQVLVYAAPDSPRVIVEPARRFILLETWTLSLDLYRTGRAGPDSGADVALPTIYKHGIVLFRSLYSLLRVLPAWKFYKRLKRRTGGVNRNGNLAIQLRVRPQGGADMDGRDRDVLRFGVSPSPAYAPLPTQKHTFAPIPHLLGTLALSAEYLAAPHYFQLDEREALLSSGFLSFDRQGDDHTGFVPTLERHRQRDSISGSNLNAVPVARSPPRAVGIGRALSTGTGTGTAGNIAGGTNQRDANLAERFLIPSRVASTGIGPSANTGSSALIPPPRPFPTMTSGSTNTNTNTTTNTTNNPTSTNPIPTSGLALNRIRKESLNSSTSSSTSTRDPFGYTPSHPTSITGTNTNPTTHTLVNPSATAASGTGTTSLSSSPSGAVPIRRPGINPVHPFKSNTLSSAGGSSPSLSIRQGGVAGSPAGIGSGQGMPSSLGREVGFGVGGTATGTHSRHTSISSTSGMQHSPVISGTRLPTINTGASPTLTGTGTGHAWPSPPGHASTFAPSSLGALAADRPSFGAGGLANRGMSVERQLEKDREKDRRRSVQGVYGVGTGTESGVTEEGRGRPMPMPRRKFESSFGHRYAASAGGSVGSGTSGVGGGGASPSVGASPGVGVGVGGGERGGSAHGSNVSVEGSGRGTPGSLREAFGPTSSPHTSTHHGVDHDNTEDKEISIFVQDIDDRKPLSGRTKEIESTGVDRRYGTRHLSDTTDATVKGKGRAVYDTNTPSVVNPDANVAYATSPMSPRGRGGPLVTSPESMSPPPPTGVTSEAAAEAAAYLSTSPQRGPMLTSEHEIDERLRRMNETFLRSLEGLSAGGSARKKKGKASSTAVSDTSSTQQHQQQEGGSEQGAESVVSTTTSAAGSGGDTTSQRSGSTSTRSGSTTSTATDTTIGAVRTSPLRESNPNPTAMISPGTRLGIVTPATGVTAFPTTTTTHEREYSPSAGLGLGLPARVRHGSTSSSMLGASTSEAGASQGSEEVIGRMELDGERRRWGYGRP